MVLKEAYRYQKFLDTLMNSATYYLNDKGNVTTVKREHMRKKMNSAADDEIEIMPKSTLFDDERINTGTVINFIMDLLEQKKLLTNAISVAKASASMDIDTAIMNNRTMQQVANVFKLMAGMKAGEKVTTGYDYKFNEAGEQVRYSYNIKEVTTIDFDRNKVKALQKKLLADSDKVSSDIDLLNVTLEVNYTPKYELTDSFEDCIVTFLG